MKPSPLVVGNAYIEMVILLIAFLVILALAYYVSRFVGKQSQQLQNKKNIKVIESVQIAPHKYIQIIQVGKRYYAIGSTKDNMNIISELNEEELKLTTDNSATLPFKALLEKHMKKKSESVTKHEYEDS